MKRYERLTEATLRPVVAESSSFVEVCRRLGKSPVGGNSTNISHLCKKWNIDTSHMTGQAHSRGKPSFKRQPPSYHLVLGSASDRRSNPTVLKRCLLDVGVEYKCNVCGLVEWNNSPMVLEIDHINSCYWDNRLENLQFICPNCHAQETKNRGRLAER